MDDLIARIRAAIDEDERLALGAVRWSEGARTWAAEGEPDWEHIARHDPERVLRQVAAHRKMLELHDQSEAHGDFNYCRACGTTARPCETLRLLAEAYGIEPNG